MSEVPWKSGLNCPPPLYFGGSARPCFLFILYLVYIMIPRCCHSCHYFRSCLGQRRRSWVHSFFSCRRRWIFAIGFSSNSSSFSAFASWHELKNNRYWFYKHGARSILKTYNMVNIKTYRYTVKSQKYPTHLFLHQFMVQFQKWPTLVGL